MVSRSPQEFLRPPTYRVIDAQRAENQRRQRAEEVYGQQLITSYSHRSIKSIRTPSVFVVSNGRTGTYEVHPFGIRFPFPPWKNSGYVFNLGEILSKYTITDMTFLITPGECDIDLYFSFDIDEEKRRAIHLGDKKEIPKKEIIDFLARFRETENGESEAILFLQDDFSRLVREKASDKTYEDAERGVLREKIDENLEGFRKKKIEEVKLKVTRYTVIPRLTQEGLRVRNALYAAQYEARAIERRADAEKYALEQLAAGNKAYVIALVEALKGAGLSLESIGRVIGQREQYRAIGESKIPIYMAPPLITQQRQEESRT